MSRGIHSGTGRRVSRCIRKGTGNGGRIRRGVGGCKGRRSRHRIGGRGRWRSRRAVGAGRGGAVGCRRAGRSRGSGSRTDRHFPNPAAESADVHGVVAEVHVLNGTERQGGNPGPGIAVVGGLEKTLILGSVIDVGGVGRVDAGGESVGRMVGDSVKGRHRNRHQGPTGAAVGGAVTAALGLGRILRRDKDGRGVGGVHVKIRGVIEGAAGHVGGDIRPAAPAVGGNKKAAGIGVTRLGGQKTVKVPPHHFQRIDILVGADKRLGGTGGPTGAIVGGFVDTLAPQGRVEDLVDGVINDGSVGRGG